MPTGVSPFCCCAYRWVERRLANANFKVSYRFKALSALISEQSFSSPNRDRYSQKDGGYLLFYKRLWGC